MHCSNNQWYNLSILHLKLKKKIQILLHQVREIESVRGQRQKKQDMGYIEEREREEDNEREREMVE